MESRRKRQLSSSIYFQFFIISINMIQSCYFSSFLNVLFHLAKLFKTIALYYTIFPFIILFVYFLVFELELFCSCFFQIFCYLFIFFCCFVCLCKNPKCKSFIMAVCRFENISKFNYWWYLSMDFVFSCCRHFGNFTFLFH